MNIKEFNSKYKEKGGLERFKEMIKDLIPQKVIAHHFGVSQERVRQWSVELLGTTYDPRPARREQALAAMVKFHNQVGLEKFKRAFRGSAYYRKALEIINKQ